MLDGKGNVLLLRLGSARAGSGAIELRFRPREIKTVVVEGK
jgi:hypothetical protein